MTAMRIDTASRLIAADARAVLAAFTDADAFVAWLPPAGMTGRLERFDPRAGGSFSMVLTYDEPPAGGGKSGADTDTSQAQITELSPERIVWQIRFPSEDQAAAPAMIMEWTLAGEARGTLVTVAARDVPAFISPADHAEGLASSLANLAAVVERG